MPRHLIRMADNATLIVLGRIVGIRTAVATIPAHPSRIRHCCAADHQATERSLLCGRLHRPSTTSAGTKSTRTAHIVAIVVRRPSRFQNGCAFPALQVVHWPTRKTLVVITTEFMPDSNCAYSSTFARSHRHRWTPASCPSHSTTFATRCNCDRKTGPPFGHRSAACRSIRCADEKNTPKSHTNIQPNNPKPTFNSHQRSQIEYLHILAGHRQYCED